MTRWATAATPDAYSLLLKNGSIPAEALPESHPYKKINGFEGVDRLSREERFYFRMAREKTRRIRVRGWLVEVNDSGQPRRSRKMLDPDSLGLFTLSRLTSEFGGPQIRQFSRLFSDIRFLRCGGFTRRGRPT